MKKYQNKYLIESACPSYWDYGSNAYYFVTICTGNRKHYFGKIQENKIQLSSIGEIANTCWLEIPIHFSVCYFAQSCGDA